MKDFALFQIAIYRESWYALGSVAIRPQARETCLQDSLWKANFCHTPRSCCHGSQNSSECICSAWTASHIYFLRITRFVPSCLFVQCEVKCPASKCNSQKCPKGGGREGASLSLSWTLLLKTMGPASQSSGSELFTKGVQNTNLTSRPSYLKEW